MPDPILVPITPPRVPVLDERTGTISREWYMFFLSLRQGIGSSSVSVDDLQKGPPAVSIDEINENINTKTADLAPSNETLYSLIAEMQKRIDALESSAAAPALGTISPLNKDYIDWLGFNKAAGYAVLPGQIGWNNADGCLDIGMGYDGVVLQTGMEMLYRIKASAAITDGQLIMFDGAVGASGVLKGKPSVTSLTSGQLIMGVATMNMATNDFGYVTAFGLVRGIDTTGSSVGETWHDGDVLYYNPAYVGSMTNVQPAAPNEKVIVAAVVNAGAGGSGSLFIRPTFLPKLSDLSNVYAPTPTNGDKLIYNGTSGRWEQDSRSYLMLE